MAQPQEWIRLQNAYAREPGLGIFMEKAVQHQAWLCNQDREEEGTYFTRQAAL